METKQLVKHLKILKKEVTNIRIENHDLGDPILRHARSNLRMIIRRIYPDHETVENQLLPQHVRMWTGSPGEEQRYYESDVKETLMAIETIEAEAKLFDFKDFTPKKHKETEWQVGAEKIGYFRKKKIE